MKFIFVAESLEAVSREQVVIDSAVSHPIEVHQHDSGVQALLPRSGTTDICTVVFLPVARELEPIMWLQIMAVTRKQIRLLDTITMTLSDGRMTLTGTVKQGP